FWLPTYWIPAIQITENDLGIGFSTKAEDILGFYSLPLTITYGILNKNLNYHLNYYNYNHFPIIHFYFSGNTTLPYQNLKNSTDQEDTSWWEEGKAGINIYFPFKGQTASTTNSRPYWQTFSLGHQYEKLSSITTTTPLDADPVNIASLRLGYYYSDAEKYGFSISPEQGHSFSLTYEHADKALGGDYTFDKLIFDDRKFIPLPFLHQVLSLRLVAGFSSPNIIDQNLDWEKFKLGGHYSADNLSNVDVETFS
ncbi:unnamed protein product, partial [marine sediment metagenome]